jgi:16S rRNA (guanine966-N2)-methyltransferase
MPAGPEIRPTLDITRKAIFDIIGERIQGAKFLDLFAGTGANGIEALSRGAAFALFVDHSKFCIKAIKDNLDRTSLSKYAKTNWRNALHFLEEFDKRKKIGDERFDIVFADPPYEKSSARKSLETKSDYLKSVDPQAKITLHLISTGAILNQNPLVIIEHSPETEMPDYEGILGIWKKRRYGSTMVSIYRKEL